MKKILNIIIISLTVFSCKGQINELQNKDLIFIQNNNENIKSTNESYSTKDKLILIFDKQIIPKPKQFVLYKENTNDTMKINCFCNYNENIYIHNLTFKNGNYNLNLINEFKNKNNKTIQINNISFKKIDVQKLLK